MELLAPLDCSEEGQRLGHERGLEALSTHEAAHWCEGREMRAVGEVLDQEIVSRNGKKMPTKIDSLCVHGDEPTAIAVAKATRAGLEAAGVKVVPLTEMGIR